MKHRITKAVTPSIETTSDNASTSQPHQRHNYSGLPTTGFVRMSQLARNAKTPDAPAIIPVSPVTIWRWIKNPKINFPKPVKLSGNVTAFRVEEIRAWLDQHEL